MFKPMAVVVIHNSVGKSRLAPLDSGKQFPIQNLIKFSGARFTRRTVFYLLRNSSMVTMNRHPEAFRDIKVLIALQPVSARPFYRTRSKDANIDKGRGDVRRSNSQIDRLRHA